jgi:hypothetical protein
MLSRLSWIANDVAYTERGELVFGLFTLIYGTAASGWRREHKTDLNPSLRLHDLDQGFAVKVCLYCDG